LRAALLQSFSTGPLTAAEQRARADLESGKFLPGRGLLDMKSGLAAGLAALEAFASTTDRAGNLLFLAVPDEEANSAGARSAAAALPDIARRLGLSLEAAINLDSLLDDGDGEAGRAIALGTVGKLLPSALVVGTPTHASNSLAGLNAGVLAAGIVAAVEWSAELTDRTGAELGPPPTLLGLKDNRTAYDVTTPDRVWAYWNVMTHRRGPAEVLAAFGAICRDSVAASLSMLDARAAALGLEARSPLDVPVLTFEELRSEVFAADPEAASRFALVAREVAGRGIDVAEQCRILSEHLWDAGRRAGPGIVIGFASWPYLPTHLAGAAGERLEAAARLAAEKASGGRKRRHCRYPGFPGYFRYELSRAGGPRRGARAGGQYAHLGVRRHLAGSSRDCRPANG
jgi:arginine utilization protein RocB